MICYTETQKIKESRFRRIPVKRPHREVVVFTEMNSKLSLEIIKRIKGMGSVEVFVILTVRAFYLTVMAWSERTDQLMFNLKLLKRTLKECKIAWYRAGEALGEFKAVVGLNTFDRETALSEVFQHIKQKLSGGIGTILLKSLKITIT